MVVIKLFEVLWLSFMCGLTEDTELAKGSANRNNIICLQHKSLGIFSILLSCKIV